MNPRAPIGAVATCTAIALLSSSSAQVECWAPGMSAPVTLSENTRHATASIGRPYRYDVFGLAGRIQLGNRAANSKLSGGQFCRELLGLLSTGTPVDSTAYVRLQTGLTRFYPEQLDVTGKQPGNEIGPVHRYGPTWTLCDPQQPREVNLTFHLAGSTLLTSLVPGLLAPAHFNLNPSGHCYVLGEYHSAPPVMTGTLSVSSTSVLYGSALPVGYRIHREEQKPVYRPPFLGLDLGDTNLTVLGTPPSKPGGGGGGGEELAPSGLGSKELVSVVVNLNGSQGTGWIKVQRQP